MASCELKLRLNSPGFLGSVDSEREHTVHYLEGDQPRTARLPVHAVDPALIRVPALRGVLEFWHRTLLGALPPKEVFARQAAVFGSAGSGQGIRLRPGGAPAGEVGELIFSGPDGYGFLYLGYGPLQIVKDPGDRRNRFTTYHKQGCRDAIKVPPETERPGGPWPEVPLVATWRRDDQRQALEASLILLHLFGGLGGRSRRGWGSIEVEAPFVDRPASGGDVAGWVQRSLAEAFRRMPEAARTGEGEPRHTAFGPGARIAVTEVIEGSYRDVLLRFYDHFRAKRIYDYQNRSRSSQLAQDDHDLELKDARSQLLTGVPKRLAYGLPYAPQSGRGRWNIEYFGTDGTDRRTRRASPLFLKVHRLGPRRHFGTALFLPAAYFGSAEMQIGAATRNRDDSKREKTGTFDPPGFGAVEAFMDAVAVAGSECAIPRGSER